MSSSGKIQTYASEQTGASESRTYWKRGLFFALLVTGFAAIHHTAAQAADASMTARQFARSKGLTVQDAGSYLLMQGAVRVRLYQNRSDATVNGKRYVLKDIVSKSGNTWVLPSRVVTFLSHEVDAHSLSARSTYTPSPQPTYSPQSTSATPHRPYRALMGRSNPYMPAHGHGAAGHGTAGHGVGNQGWPAGARIVQQGSRIFVYPATPGGSTTSLGGTVMPANGVVTRSLPSSGASLPMSSKVDVARRASSNKRSVAAKPARKSGKRKLRSIDELLGSSDGMFCSPSKRGSCPFECAPVSSSTWAPPSSVKERKWRWIVLHHSDDTSGNAAKYHKTHLEDNGWENGLGYHFVIGNGSLSGDGEVEVGPRWVRQIQGAHAKVPGNRYNEYGVGICLVGDFDEGDAEPTSKQFAAMVSLCKWLAKRYGISPRDIIGHCDCCNTACPGKNFPWAKFRAAVAR